MNGNMKFLKVSKVNGVMGESCSRIKDRDGRLALGKDEV